MKSSFAAIFRTNSAALQSVLLSVVFILSFAAAEQVSAAARFAFIDDVTILTGYLKPAAVGTTQAGDQFGWSVAVAGDTVVVGAPTEDGSTTAPAATRLVATTGTDSGDCISAACATIWHAIGQAVPGDTISIAAGTYTQWGITVNKDLTITGAGAATTIIQANAAPNAAGDRVFYVNSGVTASISGLTIRHGRLSYDPGPGMLTDGGLSFGGIPEEAPEVAADGFGAGIYNLGTLTINNTTISANSSIGPGGGFGGGIYNLGAVTITNSTISGNTTGGFGSIGGGIGNTGTLNVSNSTISGNSTIIGGGIASSGTLTVTNSTISGNYGTGGGGISNISSGVVTVTNSTIAYNTAGFFCGGGINNSPTSTVNSRSSIIANNFCSGSGFDIGGTLTSQGYNLIGVADAISGGSNDIVIEYDDAMIGPLANNGGTTQTHALLPGSRAINAGNNSGAPASDQRGIARPQQGTVDIGAFESRGFTMAVSGGNNQSASVNTAFASPLAVTVSSAFGEPVNGGQVTFTPPGSGASASIAGNLATISSGTATSGTVTANGTVGGYDVAASASGVQTGVNFSLTNLPPNLSINDVTLNEGNAGTTSFSFTVSLSAPAPAGGVTFNIATADGTGTQPNDYTQNSLTSQTIPSGSSTYSFSVLVNGDTSPETNETFFVNVTSVTGATVTDGQGLGTITNDDVAPNLSINDVTQLEGNAGTSTLQFTVSLSAPAPAGGVSFDLATANNTATTGDNDYVSNSLTGQTISAGNSTATFNVTVNGDTTIEPTETFFVNVTNVTSAITIDGQGLGTITNDDFPNLNVTRADDRNNPTCAIGDCSLREALNAAGSDGTPAIITFNIPAHSAGCVGTNCTITLGSPLVPAADAGILTTIDGGVGANRVTLSGGAQFSHILSINNGTNININDLNFTRGTSNFNGGTMAVAGGGTLTLTNSAIYGNANNAPGGGLRCDTGCVVNLTNVTISGNSSPNGGGISNEGTVTATNCTLTGNSGSFGNGGVQNSGTFNIRNTIIAGNSAFFANTSDVSGVFASQGNNLIGKTDGTNGFTQTGDQTGTVAAPLDARLAPLGNYGGKTLTHALLDGGAIPSPAINTGTATGAPSTDQRGAARVGVVDIGAFEVNNTANGGSFVAVLPVGSQIISYLAPITANNGAFTYSVTSGTLPNGISLTTNVAPTAIVALSGTATQNGIFNFGITATNGANSNVTNYSVQFLGPSSAGVSISGRVLTPAGNGLRNAIVQLTDLQGNTRTARTGSFGYYRFDDVEAGQTYVIGVASKRFVFTPRTISVSDELTDVDLVAEAP